MAQPDPQVDPLVLAAEQVFRVSMARAVLGARSRGARIDMLASFIAGMAVEAVLQIENEHLRGEVIADMLERWGIKVEA